MTLEWDIRPDGSVVLTPWDHTHQWGEWSAWARRDKNHVERMRSCSGCTTTEHNTEYEPEVEARR